MFIRPTANTRKFLESQPVEARRYEWLPLYEVGQRVITIIHGKLIETPFASIPTHEAFCDWLDAMQQDWFDNVAEPQL